MIFQLLKNIHFSRDVAHANPKGGSVLSRLESLYACMFEGIRYDAGDKLGYLNATVEYALESPELGQPFSNYLDELHENARTILV